MPCMQHTITIYLHELKSVFYFYNIYWTFLVCSFIQLKQLTNYAKIHKYIMHKYGFDLIVFDLFQEEREKSRV